MHRVRRTRLSRPVSRPRARAVRAHRLRTALTTTLGPIIEDTRMRVLSLRSRLRRIVLPLLLPPLPLLLRIGTDARSNTHTRRHIDLLRLRRRHDTVIAADAPRCTSPRCRRHLRTTIDDLHPRTLTRPSRSTEPRTRRTRNRLRRTHPHRLRTGGIPLVEHMQLALTFTSPLFSLPLPLALFTLVFPRRHRNLAFPLPLTLSLPTIKSRIVPAMSTVVPFRRASTRDRRRRRWDASLLLLPIRGRLRA